MWQLDPVLITVAALALSAVFLTAAAHKLRAPRLFESQLADYRLLPVRLERPVARLLPGLELSAALALLYAPLRPAAALALLALLALYSGAIAINLGRGRSAIDCGCLGAALRQELSPWLLVRNGLLGLLAGACLAAPQARPLGLHDGFTVLAATLCLLLLYVAVNYLIAFYPRIHESRG
ncbi:MAG TPA: MauE/DoxX family redox-associated membrane protein [Candidatus Competibacteraceae bacterium]|nr:MauE/DoxX family redox-associated membrane protein [Candidatus Competibacteraceae bacterium]